MNLVEKHCFYSSQVLGFMGERLAVPIKVILTFWLEGHRFESTKATRVNHLCLWCSFFSFIKMKIFVLFFLEKKFYIEGRQV